MKFKLRNRESVELLPSLLTFKILKEKYQMTIADVQEAMKNNYFESLAYIPYCAYEANCKIYNEKVEYTEDQFLDAISLMTHEEFGDLVAGLMDMKFFEGMLNLADNATNEQDAPKVTGAK